MVPNRVQGNNFLAAVVIRITIRGMAFANSLGIVGNRCMFY